jgi:hypothetical protein
MINKIIFHALLMLVLSQFNQISLASSLIIGYGSQSFNAHNSKESASLTDIEYAYQYMDKMDFKLLARANKTEFRFSIPEIGYNESITLSLIDAGVYLGWHTYTDFIPGKWTTQLQAYRSQGDLSDPLLGDAQAGSAGLRFETFSGNFFVDAHYSSSKYQEEFTTKQWDIGIGKMFMENKIWLQLRQFQIETDFPSTFYAVETLLKYWLETQWILAADNWFFSYSFGNQHLIYNPESQVLWNNIDMIHNAYRAGITWDLPGKFSASVIYAETFYQKLYLEDKYNNQTFYVEIQKNF